MSSDGSSLTVMGMANSQPVILDVNTLDGSINRFFFTEWTA
jgi:hypothetical protein